MEGLAKLMGCHFLGEFPQPIYKRIAIRRECWETLNGNNPDRVCHADLPPKTAPSVMLVIWTGERGKDVKEEAYTRQGHQQATGSRGGSGPGANSSLGKSPVRSHGAGFLPVA